jgi:glycosyltransferase involved in cell wall biosynthesis
MENFIGMRFESKISVIIPALNEEKALGFVLDDIPLWVDEVIVVDNGSTDNTENVAISRGVKVVPQPVQGYGNACLTGIESVSSPYVVVFLDGDYSDYPDEMDLLVDPILKDEADMVIGSRILGEREKASLTGLAILGNKLTCILIRLFWHQTCSDLGPFRAIKFDDLLALKMKDKDYGWTVEMQVKAVKMGFRVLEVPVSYRNRIGVSKISRNTIEAIKAGVKIMFTVFRYVFLD